MPNSTICWSCKNACGKCSWSSNFTPIDGWVAKPTKIKTDYATDGSIISYIVLDCPQYNKDIDEPLTRTEFVMKKYGISERAYYRWVRNGLITKDGEPLDQERINKTLRRKNYGEDTRHRKDHA